VRRVGEVGVGRGHLRNERQPVAHGQHLDEPLDERRRLGALGERRHDVALLLRRERGVRERAPQRGVGLELAREGAQLLLERERLVLAARLGDLEQRAGVAARQAARDALHRANPVA